MGFKEMASQFAEEKLSDIKLKVNKLLSLKNDKTGNANESQSAALMAQKLMLKYDITEKEALEAGLTQDGIDFIKRSKKVYKKPLTDYIVLSFLHKRLAMILSSNFRCYTFTESWNKKQRIVFLGIKEDADIAGEVYAFALTAIEHLSENYIDSRTDLFSTERKAVKNDYIIAYLKGLEDKFNEQVRENEFQLALVKDEIVVVEHDKLSLRSGGRMNYGKTSHDADAMSKGYKDGKSFNYANQRLK
jgi:hypothetical protein